MRSVKVPSFAGPNNMGKNRQYKGNLKFETVEAVV